MMREAPKQKEISNSPFGTIRSKIAITLIGAMGTGCCFSLGFNTNPVEKARSEAVNGCENVKHIRIPEARASVLLGREEEGKELVKALLYIEPTSPLRTHPTRAVTYKLPTDSEPWESLVIEPSGRITLRIEGNAIALSFDCAALTNESPPTCIGKEIDPKELAVDPDSDAGVPESEAGAETATDAATDATTDAGADAQTDIPEGPDRIFDENGKIIYNTTPEIAAQLEKLRPALEAADLGWLKIVAREAAKKANNGKYKDQIETLIQEMEAGAQDNLREIANKENISSAILVLLSQYPEALTQVAKVLKVDLGNSEETATHETATKELSEIRSILESATDEKVKKVAKMISHTTDAEMSRMNRSQVMADLTDWLGQHYSSKDYKTITAVIHFLKGEVTDADKAHIRNMYEHDIPN